MTFCLSHVIIVTITKELPEVKNMSLQSEPIKKLLPKYAVPCMISYLVNALYNIVDQIFVGRGVGHIGMAATNIAFPIAIFGLAVSLLIGDGAAAFLSLSLGHGEKEKAEKGVGNTITLLTVTGIIISSLCILFRHPLIQLFGATKATYQGALDYMVILLIGMPFCMIANGCLSILRADGNPKLSMTAMIAGAVINLILDPVFIFGFGWGVRGAAAATILGQLASFFIGLYGLFHLKSIALHREDFFMDKQILGRVAALGTSSFISEVSVTIVMIVMNNMLKIYGAKSQYGSEIPISVAGIIMKVNQILSAFVLGLASGAQPIAGFHYGAGNLKKVMETYKISVIFAVLISIPAFLIYQFFPEYILRLFGAHTELYLKFGVKGFRIFLFFCILTGFQTVTSIFLQSIGKPAKASILSLSRQIFFFLPAVVILPAFLGVEGCLYAGMIADVLAFLLALIVIIPEIKKLKKDLPHSNKKYHML